MCSSDLVSDPRDAAGHHLGGDQAHPRNPEPHPQPREDLRGGVGEDNVPNDLPRRRTQNPDRIDQRHPNALDAPDGVHQDGKEDPDEKFCCPSGCRQFKRGFCFFQLQFNMTNAMSFKEEAILDMVAEKDNLQTTDRKSVV